MRKPGLIVAETFLLVAAVVVGTAWLVSGDGKYEPPLAFITIALAIVEFVRRTGGDASDNEIGLINGGYALHPAVREDLLAGQVTVCAECEHFFNKNVGSSIWYNHYCTASPLQQKIDPFDGKTKSFSVNDLGGEYFTDDEFNYCRSINDGACSKFERQVAAKDA